MRKATSAGGIFVKKEKNKHYLLLLKYSHTVGLGFLKGHVETGETIEEAALREIREEAGLEKVNIIEKIGVVSRDTVEKSGELVSKTIHLFLMKTSVFEHKPSEEDYGWFEYDEAVSQMLNMEDAEFLRKYKKKILSEFF